MHQELPDRAAGAGPFRLRVAASYHLTIPKLGLKGLHILKVGTTKGGALKIGESIHLGWTPKGGNAPGHGSILIVAHSNHAGYGPFNGLYKLRKGNLQELAVGRKVLRYKVVRKPFFVKRLSTKLISEMTQSGGPSTLWTATCALNHYDRKHNRYTGWEISQAVQAKHTHHE